MPCSFDSPRTVTGGQERRRSRRRSKGVRESVLEPLEARLVPTMLTWVGDVDNLWSTYAGGNTNWSGDQLPAPGDVLLFDNTASSARTTFNDTPSQTLYGSIRITGKDYSLVGNPI